MCQSWDVKPNSLCQSSQNKPTCRVWEVKINFQIILRKIWFLCQHPLSEVYNTPTWKDTWRPHWRCFGRLRSVGFVFYTDLKGFFFSWLHFLTTTPWCATLNGCLSWRWCWKNHCERYTHESQVYETLTSPTPWYWAVLQHHPQAWRILCSVSLSLVMPPTLFTDLHHIWSWHNSSLPEGFEI